MNAVEPFHNLSWSGSTALYKGNDLEFQSHALVIEDSRKHTQELFQIKIWSERPKFRGIQPLRPEASFRGAGGPSPPRKKIKRKKKEK